MQLIQTIFEGPLEDAENEGVTAKVSGEIEIKSSSFGSQTQRRGLTGRSLSKKKDDKKSDGDTSDNSFFIRIIVMRNKVKMMDGESEMEKLADAK